MTLKPSDVLPSKVIIAGPCSAESREQVMKTAKALSSIGVNNFRAGVWKPRTQPGHFEGAGSQALEWLGQVHEETGMSVSTEVACGRHVEQVLKAGIDIIWLGARTSTSPFAVQEIAESLRGCDVTVLVKNPVNPDLDLWIGAIERLRNAGVNRIAAVHRGFSTYGESTYRNTPLWQIPIELRRQMPDLQIICDPSHIGGNRRFILPLSQMALEMNADGLMIEAHCEPDRALSDATQQITPDVLNQILKQLQVRKSPEEAEHSDLSQLRSQMDSLDMTLIETLSKRMILSRQIGRYKLEHNLSVLQSGRYEEIVRELQNKGEEFSLSRKFVRDLFETVHTESIKVQLEESEKSM